MPKLQKVSGWREAYILAAVMAFMLALALISAPAYAQEGDDETFCAIPEGCDTDGDGVPDVPAGAPITSDQYGGEPICLLPEGCPPGAEPPGPPIEGAPPDPGDAPADPIQDEQPVCLIPEGCDTDGDGIVDVPAGTPISPDVPPVDESPTEEVPPGEAPPEEVLPVEVVPGEEVVSEPGEAVSAEPVSGEAGGPPAETLGSAGVSVLPETGGLLPVFVVGLLLFGSGLLVRRMVR